VVSQGLPIDPRWGRRKGEVDKVVGRRGGDQKKKRN